MEIMIKKLVLSLYNDIFGIGNRVEMKCILNVKILLSDDLSFVDWKSLFLKLRRFSLILIDISVVKNCF